MDRQILREVIWTRGWTKTHLALALGYSPRALSYWLSGRVTVPPGVMAWVNRLPALPSVDPSYSPDPEGLKQFRKDGNYTATEIAVMVRTQPETVCRWLQGTQGIPVGVQAWLRAGGPSEWLWWPPGYTPVAETLSGRPHKPFKLRAGKLGTHLEKYPAKQGGWRWRRVGGPRSCRERRAVQTGNLPWDMRKNRPVRV